MYKMLICMLVHFVIDIFCPIHVLGTINRENKDLSQSS